MRRWLVVGLVGLGAGLPVAPALAAGPSAPVQLVLPLQADAAGLARFALAVSSPSSPRYGQYESIPALARRFGASPSTRRKVVAWLRAHGGRAVHVDATGDLAEATMTPTLAQRLFGGRAAVARGGASPPGGGGLVPAPLRGSVQAVYGARTQPLPLISGVERAGSSRLRGTASAQQPTSERPRTGTPRGCAGGRSAGEIGGVASTGAFTPNQYLTAYGFSPLYSLHLAGQGERVALIETDGVRPSDLRRFAGCFLGSGTPIPPLHQYGVGIRRLPRPGREATLDTEVMEVVAPRLAGIDLYETKPDVSHFLTALNAPLQRRRHRPQVISTSLGTCDPFAKAALGRAGLRAAQFALEAATASGITVVAAAGDTGSAGCRRGGGRPPERRLAVVYPASSRFVTGVGGTNLELTKSNQISEELVWNDTSDGLGAGGGGYSSIWSRPPMQDGLVKRNARAVPDVAMLADGHPGYAIYCTTADCRHISPFSHWLGVGGTSAAAPLLAGGLALIDQDLRLHNREYLGSLNPLLYRIGGSKLASGVFNDVTRFGNDVGPFLPGGGAPLGCCTAHTGYDEASGWGSVNMGALLSAVLALEPKRMGNVRASVPSHQRPVADNRLKVRITCSRGCHAAAEVVVRAGRANPFKLASPTFYLNRAGSKTVLVSFNPGARRTLSPGERKRLRAALGKHTAVRAIAYGVLETSSHRVEKYSAPAPFRIRN